MRLLNFLLGKEKSANSNLAITLHDPNKPLTEDNLIKWHFDELLKTLITLSSPADRQAEIMGFGNANSEMVEDFVWHYIETKDDLTTELILIEPQTIVLDNITKLIDKHSGKPEDNFWNPEQLKTHSDWTTIRKIATEVLILLGKDNLQLKIETTNEYDKSDKGEKLIIQRQKIYLINNEKKQ